MNALDGEVAVVTGARHGIGRAIAEALADAGARVAVTHHDSAVAEAVAGEIGPGHAGFALDVRSRRQQSQQQTAVANSTTTPAEGTVAMIKRNWRRMVLAVVLWAVAAVGLVAVGASPEIATWVAGLLPLAVLLYLHRRSS
jgi:NAD(P)-dependent dehydrogenase (short-subunit alcohol dehydrogenase family)